MVRGGQDGLDDLRGAVPALSGAPGKLELARALVDHGALLRRSNERQAAREPLRRGLEIAARCGATALVDRAREELEATGARSRSLVLSGVESLTASERRVASLAADGRTNTEIAQALYVTRKPVETHLRHVFQKLDVQSRRELPGVLARSTSMAASSSAPNSSETPLSQSQATSTIAPAKAP